MKPFIAELPRNEDMIISMSAYYRVQKDLVGYVLESPRPYDTWLSITEEFKPVHEWTKRWRDNCINELIRGWINSDPVIMSLEKLKVTPLMRCEIAYRSGIHYAMQEGVWTPEYRKLGMIYHEALAPEGENPDCT